MLQTHTIRDHIVAALSYTRHCALSFSPVDMHKHRQARSDNREKVTSPGKRERMSGRRTESLRTVAHLPAEPEAWMVTLNIEHSRIGLGMRIESFGNLAAHSSSSTERDHSDAPLSLASVKRARCRCSQCVGSAPQRSALAEMNTSSSVMLKNS